jgi:hypothetical protein
MVAQWTEDLLGTVENFEANVPGRGSPWDVLFLNNEAVLGVSKVSAKIDTGTDVQKAKGQKRARVVDNGSAPVKFTISIELQSGEINAFARDIVPLIRPKSKTEGQPRLKVSHPEFALWGVFIVKVTNVTSEPPRSGGTKIITIDVIEDVPPEKNKKNNKVKGSAPEKEPEASVDDRIASNLRTDVNESQE